MPHTVRWFRIEVLTDAVDGTPVVDLDGNTHISDGGYTVLAAEEITAATVKGALTKARNLAKRVARAKGLIDLQSLSVCATARYGSASGALLGSTTEPAVPPLTF